MSSLNHYALLLATYGVVFMMIVAFFARLTRKDEDFGMPHVVAIVLIAGAWPLWIVAAVIVWAIGATASRKPVEPP